MRRSVEGWRQRNTLAFLVKLARVPLFPPPLLACLHTHTHTQGRPELQEIRGGKHFTSGRGGGLCLTNLWNSITHTMNERAVAHNVGSGHEGKVRETLVCESSRLAWGGCLRESGVVRGGCLSVVSINATRGRSGGCGGLCGRGEGSRRRKGMDDGERMPWRWWSRGGLRSSPFPPPRRSFCLVRACQGTVLRKEPGKQSRGKSSGLRYLSRGSRLELRPRSRP
jgi:hypothetical protein